jgi:hypothetical protein
VKTLFIFPVAVGLLLFTATAVAQVTTPKTSGVYVTADDYKNGRLSFEGDCGSKAHRLELHDVLHKSYIHVTHETEKRRFAKNDLFGFRACDGHDYRFASNLEHQILETRELYIYARDVYVSHGRGRHTTRGYFFSAGAEGPVLALTSANLKTAFPDNHKFHDALDAAFGAKQKPSEYDESQKMFKVNQLLIASRE